MIKLELDVRPLSWMAPHRSNKVFFNPRHTEKQMTILLIRAQFSGVPLSDYVDLDFTFYSKIPKSASKKRHKDMADGKILPTKMDLSNCVKFYEDCLKHTVIEDDRVVAKITAQKFYGHEDRVIISVRPHEADS
jgi:Holliday junction resolvase RusA-like endonuclease